MSRGPLTPEQASHWLISSRILFAAFPCPATLFFLSLSIAIRRFWLSPASYFGLANYRKDFMTETLFLLSLLTTSPDSSSSEVTPQ